MLWPRCVLISLALGWILHTIAGVYDLGDVRSSGALFVRKVSAVLDPNLVRLLPVADPTTIPNITWPFVLNVTDKPDWGEAKELWDKMRLEQQAVRDRESIEEDDEEL